MFDVSLTNTENPKKLWDLYMKHSHIIMFVLDSSDRQSIKGQGRSCHPSKYAIAFEVGGSARAWVSTSPFRSRNISCDPHWAFRQDVTASCREYFCLVVRWDRADWLFTTFWAQDLHYQRCEKDQHGWRVFERCSSTGRSFVFSSHAAIHRRRQWGAKQNC